MTPLFPYLCVCRFNERYSKDLVATKKKLSEAQTRIAVLEKQVGDGALGVTHLVAGEQNC